MYTRFENDVASCRTCLHANKIFTSRVSDTILLDLLSIHAPSNGYNIFSQCYPCI